MKLLLVGSTGLVGCLVLTLALEDSRVSEVVVLSRKALSVEHAKLRTLLVDFDNLPDDPDLWKVDAVICTLGTTMRVAGSKEAFRLVDFTYPLAIAKKTYEHGSQTYVLNSASGANPDSSIFYNKVKGELEQALIGLSFASLALVRPGLIGGERSEFRLGESVGAAVLSFLGPILPRRLRVNPAPKIAEALLESAIQGSDGVCVVSSDQLI
ncbi:NAD(P)H-binding protein [Marinomonas polaris]|uniref:NAD(P)H-binding protein n=1 Tax=Marinomonas polaris TaxID=293552 RepID=UPI003F9E236A